jgi:hypothetical protein
MSLKKIATNIALSASVLTTSVAIANTANAGVTLTYGNPGAQTSTVANTQIITTSIQKNDNPGIYKSLRLTDASGKAVGTIKNAFLQGTNEYGGLGGQESYLDVDQNSASSEFGVSNDTSMTLNLNNPITYFGLDWEAGDPYNVLTFYGDVNGVEQKVYQTTTQGVFDSVGSQYYGNPAAGQYQGQDGSEPFAFLNFFATNGTTFNKIVFSDDGNTGFESTNWTIAEAYTSTSGRSIPESSTTLGVLLVAGLGLLSQRKRVFGKI